MPQFMTGTTTAIPTSKPFVAADDRLGAAKEIALKLLSYCRANDWAGYDPYDALNSRIFQALPFLNFKLARLMLTQANKRSPINLRPLLLVPKSHNPKGLALFLVSLLKLRRAGLVEDDGTVGRMADRILALRSENTPYTCWGYNFAWQTRFELVPRGLPNIICTTFAGNALLDLHASSREARYLEATVSAANFILDVLYWKPSASDSCFSYTPLWRAQVHNANLLGAAFLYRVGQASGEKRFLEPALEAARFSVKHQYDDGSWDYGESDSPSQRWKDNFHTGYNLCALRDLGWHADTKEFEPAVRLGFQFYREHFFSEDGAPKYYHNATYPIDVHSVAQSVITLLALRDLGEANVELARSVLAWSISNMWDERRSYFYCQKHPRYTVKIPYMRWAQAWMLLALATLLEHGTQEIRK